MTAATARVFRFDASSHEYIDLATGAVLPHITGMLEHAGLVDTRWYTEEHSTRGTIVHELTAAYDLGALTLDGCVSKHRGYLMAHAKAMSILKPEVLGVEEPLVHPGYRFGGRPDRRLVVDGRQAVLEIKTGPPDRSHPIQTALQAILVAGAGEVSVPPEMVARFALYVKENGRFKVEEHLERRDFDQARKIIRDCCGVRW